MWISVIFLGLILGPDSLRAQEAEIAENVIDVREGQEVRLECRFAAEDNPDDKISLYWIRTNRNGYDNVAIGDTIFQENYSVQHEPENGIYDLTISSAEYDRDNGQYECRMKEGGTGNVLHTKSLELTVLLAPSAPKISPEGNAITATEGRQVNLTCASLGGSPPPQIKWYSIVEDSTAEILDSVTHIEGKNKDEPTMAVLAITPTKEHDGSKYKCAVWNRAMDEAAAPLEAETQIFVDYFPRVTIGPENPLRVEKDGTVVLECAVDAKPAVSNVKWTRDGIYIDTNFKHNIPRVTLEEAGVYICSADNGLGQIGKAEIHVDVLHAPIVTLPAESREVKAGESIAIECKINSNPRPSTVEWFKKNDLEFHQTGEILRLSSIDASDNGEYICSATNHIQTTAGESREGLGNATMEINVRHSPGKAFINPENPVAVDGKSVTMRCGADPPGYPKPRYRWWRGSRNSDQTLAMGEEFTIESARLDSAGEYHCQATNELGTGDAASAELKVFQAPKIITHLQPTIMKRAGDTGFHVTCSAIGKPKPAVKWFKDGKEISATDSYLYQIETSVQEAVPNMAYNVLSTLQYIGEERIAGGQLMPTDRGQYTCRFENDVAHSETTMLLRIEHSPVVVHEHNKVAYDLGEIAFISCRMQAYPKPEFYWSFGNTRLQPDRLNYDYNMTALEDDVYESVLMITNINENQYGDYICKGNNDMGSKRTIIKLQRKSKPDRPSDVRAVGVGYDFVTLLWEEGFDGGYNTSFTVEYKRFDGGEPKYADCGYKNPCNITTLDHHTQYFVRVKAGNIRGESHFSRDVAVSTKIDASMIPNAENVYYATSTKTVSFNVFSSDNLLLIAKVELENEDGTWSPYDELEMAGNQYGQMEIITNEVPLEGRNLKMEQQLAQQQQQKAEEPQHAKNVQVLFCVETNEEVCGEPVSALKVEVSPTMTLGVGKGSVEGWLIAVIIFGCVAFIMVAVLIAKCCCCSGNKASNGNASSAKNNVRKKKKERPNIVHPNPNTGNQEIYNNFNGGLENKGVDTAGVIKDRNTFINDNDSDDIIKNNIYEYQNGVVTNNGGGGPMMNGNPNGAAMYPQSGSSGSGNGTGSGSVNSQESLWKNNQQAQIQAMNDYAQHQYLQQQQQLYQQDQQQMYGQQQDQHQQQYDNMMMQQHHHQQQQQQHQYGSSAEDYAHYPYPDEYLNERNSQYLMENTYGQQQEYNYGNEMGLQDPYIHQHIDQQQNLHHHSQSPYLQQQNGQQTNQDDSQQDDGDFGNRSRRIIREIIV